MCGVQSCPLGGFDDDLFSEVIADWHVMMPLYILAMGNAFCA
jgi:hypothetical protein